MTNKITIVEAIKQVLKINTEGMTSQDIYREIIPSVFIFKTCLIASTIVI